MEHLCAKCFWNLPFLAQMLQIDPISRASERHPPSQFPFEKSPSRANTTSIHILQKALITVALYIGQGILKRINSDSSTFPLILLVQIFQIHCRWPNELTELDWNDELNFFWGFQNYLPRNIVLIDAQKTHNSHRLCPQWRWPIIYPIW